MSHRILKDFAGSQDGTVTEQFAAGTIRQLTPYLVSCVPPDWIEAVAEGSAASVGADATPRAAKVTVDNKAIATDGVRPARKRKTIN